MQLELRSRCLRHADVPHPNMAPAQPVHEVGCDHPQHTEGQGSPALRAPHAGVLASRHTPNFAADLTILASLPVRCGVRSAPRQDSPQRPLHLGAPLRLDLLDVAEAAWSSVVEACEQLSAPRPGVEHEVRRRLTLLGVAGLVKMLQGTGPFTAFAPTDDASAESGRVTGNAGAPFAPSRCTPWPVNTSSRQSSAGTAALSAQRDRPVARWPRPCPGRAPLAHCSPTCGAAVVRMSQPRSKKRRPTARRWPAPRGAGSRWPARTPRRRGGRSR